MPLSLKAMDYFTTAVRYGNIAKAASKLNIAASAISTAIDQVETAFDLTLLTRQRSKGIQPNANGVAVAQKLNRLLEDYRSVMAEGVALKSALSGDLKIGYYAPVAPAFLLQILSSFVSDPAQITLHLEECDNDAAQDGLLNGTYDVILFVSEAARPSIAFDVLTHAPAYCLLPISHPLADRLTLTLAQIAENPLIVLNRPTAATYYQDILKSHEPTIAAYVNSTEMLRGLVANGQGLAILNMRPLTDVSYGGKALKCIPISDPLPPLTLSIAYDKSRPRRLVQAFVAGCTSYFNTSDGQKTLVR